MNVRWLLARLERLEEAEEATRSPAQRFLTVAFVEPRASRGELRGLYLNSLEGENYVGRQANESENAFVERAKAKATATATAQGITVLFEDRPPLWASS